jgi:aspartyl/asparaginyl-tRNA synthetase
MIVASGLPRIYELGPFWRAETKQSFRHLQESIGLDVETANPESLKELYELAYAVIREVKNELGKVHGIGYDHLSLPDFSAVPIITYAEAIDILNTKGHATSFGEDLGLMGERSLGQIMKRSCGSDVCILTDYPDTIKKFYTKKKDGGTTETFDIILAGWELVSGAIRETNRSVIEKSMRLAGINSADYEFYLSIVDGAVPHGGFCLGFDRLIAKLLDLEIVSDAVVFPRTFEKLFP